MRIPWIIIIAAVLAFSTSCSKKGPSFTNSPGEKRTKGLKKERVHVVIDEKTIATPEDCHFLLEPVWWTANIYDSYRDYESSLTKFSPGQRHLFAIEWYRAEVDNGGHDQFYFNSTGIVWEDALKGFQEIGVPEAAAIIRESAKRMGGRPSFDREERINALDQKKPKFGDLDDSFYKLEKDLDGKMLAYMRTHPKQFLFDGEIERPILPKIKD